jgi:hypothetical protein
LGWRRKGQARRVRIADGSSVGDDLERNYHPDGTGRPEGFLRISREEVEAMMVHGMQSRSHSNKSGNLRVFADHEDNRREEIRRITTLVDAWLMSQYQAGSNRGGASRAERKLHTAIKNGPFYDKVLSFAGLNIWVDTRTPDGVVESQEAINL